MKTWKWIAVVVLIGLCVLAAPREAQAQVSGSVPITLTAEQYTVVKAAVEAYNANNGTELTVIQWATQVATKAIVEEAEKSNSVEVRSIRYVWPELTKAERDALIARKKEILEARQNQE